jgi:cytidylate kinase
MRKRYIIAIDGPSGAGKSTVSQELARRLGYLYLDTGAMYRAAALAARRRGVALDDAAGLQRMCADLRIRLVLEQGKLRTLLDEEDVSEAIRTPEMSQGASRISAQPPVRERLWQLQRELGREGGVVAEGRDIGTVVFPGAEHKFFLDASPEERARRRYEELKTKGLAVDYAATLREIQTRDANDRQRALAPLQPAKDAIIIDCTALSAEAVVEMMMRLVAERRPARDNTLGV